MSRNRGNPVLTNPKIMRIIDYSDKAIAVIGDTKPYKDELKAIGGKFNPYLKCGAGWIFPAKRKAEVESFINANAFTLDAFDLDLEDRMAEQTRMTLLERGSDDDPSAYTWRRY